MNYSERVSIFQRNLGAAADLAFLPISADLQYLVGVPRDLPTYGWTMHPGAWLEGLWITPGRDGVLTLPRMTAEFGGLSDLKGVNLRVLGDHDDPATLVGELLAAFDLPDAARVAVGDRAHAETLVALQALLPGVRFVSGTQIVRQQRVIKREDEIAQMRKAGAITEAAFADTIKALKHGMTELDVISEVNHQLRRHGSLGESFTTSLYCSGPDHPLLFGQRQATAQRQLNPPVALLFDFGAIYDGYCYDYGRTVCFGQPDAEMQRVYDLVMQSQAAGIAALQAEVNTTAQTDAAARDVIEAAGYGEAFRHRLGHAIGMDVHEPPFLTASDNTLLQAGMLFTIEPSITQFNSFSARVEDVVVARPSGGEKLTDGFQALIVID
ncbi:MAG: aminopeptidase P family protein [Chloroflexi bacterium]|nr:aminopeptidase P family protein [Chloroflexota bacterium]